MSQTIGGIIAPVVGNLADTYSLPAAMMTLVPFLVVGLGASLILKDPKNYNKKAVVSKLETTVFSIKIFEFLPNYIFIPYLVLSVYLP